MPMIALIDSELPLSATERPLDCPQAKVKLEAELLGTASVRIENGQLPPPPVDASEHEVMMMASDCMLIASPHQVTIASLNQEVVSSKLAKAEVEAALGTARRELSSLKSRLGEIEAQGSSTAAGEASAANAAALAKAEAAAAAQAAAESKLATAEAKLATEAAAAAELRQAITVLTQENEKVGAKAGGWPLSAC